MLSLKEKIRQSGDPASQYRGAPFWALTGDLQADELIEQIRNFKKMGLGGFFLHARIGLETEYLSEEWFDLIRVCVEEARKLDMKAYLYDEDRYPSGDAGALAVKDHPEFRSQRIFLEEIEFENVKNYSLPENTVSIFAAKHAGNDKKIKDLRRIQQTSEVNEEEFMLVFTKGEAQHNSWYNGYCYLDTLNKDAVKYFIELTHEQYYKHFKDDFGTVIPAIFCDEPRYGFVSTMLPWEDETVYSTPWNDQLRENIRNNHGIDIFEYLPALFFDIENNQYPSERYCYIAELTALFLDSFMNTVYQWCEEHNIMLTGHMIGEDTLATQSWSCGSCMRAYKYFGMPGVDQLGEMTRGYQVAKQLSSAARQLGKPLRLTETYGCTGWDFPLAGHKALGDWQVVSGINFRCQHLAHYTIRGEAKRDYPASISYQSPWNSEYSHIENYFSRLNLMLTGNEEKRDILLFSPIESAWMQIKKDLWCDKDIAGFDREFIAVQNELLKNQLDFDFADEVLALELGNVIQSGNGTPLLQIGKAAYKMVILPSMITIRQTTVDLLEKFITAGGKVFACGSLPCRINGKESAEKLNCFTAKLNKIPLKKLSDAAEYLRRVEVTAKENKRSDSILYMESAGKDCEYLFLVNTGYPLDTVIENSSVLRCPAVAERTLAVNNATLYWNVSEKYDRYMEFIPESGALLPLEVKFIDGKAVIPVSMDALASKMIIRTAGNWQEPSETELLNVKMDSSNVLLLDSFEASFPPSKEFTKPLLATALDDEIRKKIGLPKRNFMMIQPWFRKKFQLAEKRASAPVELRKIFRIDTLPAGDVFLALEEPELYEISINGKVIDNSTEGFFIDKAICKIKLPANVLQPGENTLLCRCIYSEKHPGLEAMYILGDFGVKLDGNDGVITAKNEKLSIGDISGQGYPFYSGNITYSFQVPPQAKEVEITSFKGAVASVRYQNMVLPPVINAPGEITLPPGGGNLEITICISPRNLFGPFYWPGKLSSCGPDQFTCTKNPVRQLTEAGLTDISIN